MKAHDVCWRRQIFLPTKKKEAGCCFGLNVPAVIVLSVKPALRIDDSRATVKVNSVIAPDLPATEELTVVPLCEHQQNMTLAHSARFWLGLNMHSIRLAPTHLAFREKKNITICWSAAWQCVLLS